MRKVESPFDTLANILTDAAAEKLGDRMPLDDRETSRNVCRLASKREGRVTW